MLLLPTVTLRAEEVTYFDEANYIIEFKIRQSGAKNYDEWIDSLAIGAGNGSEWYVMATQQLEKETDLGAYVQALANRLSSDEMKGTNAQRCALSCLAANCKSVYIEHAAQNTIGSQGIMSYIWGLHLLNNGVFSDKFSQEELINKIISFHLEDGGFALSGTQSNVDVTAMAITALSPYHLENSDVASVVDKALLFLSTAQTEKGGFLNYGVENCESAAQVIIALCSLGIDPETDTRFIKNGKSAVDSLRTYALTDGSYCHEIEKGYNEIATQQALHAFTALHRAENGKSALFVFDKHPDTTYPGFSDVVFGKSEAPIAPTDEKTFGVKEIVCISVIALCCVGIVIALILPKKKDEEA